MTASNRSILRNIFKIPLLRNSLFVCLAVSISFPVYGIFYEMPSLVRVVQKISENEALRVATHLTKTIFPERFTLKREYFSNDIIAEVEVIIEDFQLEKIRIFSESGEIVYSSDSKDIGKLNKKKYFHEIVARGNIYSKVVKKEDKSAEGQIVTSDVVEIYVPLIDKGKFHGAFEIYYDVTDKSEMLNNQFLRSLYVLSALALIVFISIILLLLRASKISLDNKRKESTLQESEERHRLLVESTSDAILVLDTDRKIVSCNRSFLDLFGYSQTEVIGQSTSMIHPSEESYRSFGDAAYLEIKRSDSFRTEWEFLRRNGTVFPVETTTSAIKSPEGETTGYVAIIRDITERKKAEEAVQRAKEKTDLANKAKSEFLANMSHEIRTPMNSVIGFTDMLMDTDLNEDQKDYAETIKSSGETLLILINDILDFSKIEAGELDFEAVDFDPGLLAYDICNAIRPRMGSKPIEVICHIGDDLPAYVKGDPGRFRQVLSNLIGNASKFTEAGEIELALNAETERNDRIRLHAKVRDTGIGLSEEKLSTIFEPFHQADGSTTRKYGGTGLGLSICKQISNLMDGDIWAESKVDKGSIFHFTAWFEKAEKKETKRFTPLSLSGKKALIVDDNKRNLDILQHILRSIGMDVVALKNGEEVMPTFQDAKKTGSPFDLCIIDIQMPVISGYDVARAIRRWEGQRQKAKESKRRIPLIALSSLMQRDAKKCKEAGFDAFLSKPVHKEKLYQMLERMVAGREYEAVGENAAREKIITQYTIREEMKNSVRILLAEDNPVNQKLATMMLTKAGYRVEVAVNGREAVDKYTATPADFDLIFMDVQMPEMDGIEATKEIRGFERRNQLSLDNQQSSSPKLDLRIALTINNQQSTIPKIPIVAMTAHAMKGDMEKCLEAGMDDYITKPIKREIVLGILEKWVFKTDRP